LFDEQKIKQILMEADVLVCPSYAEGMPTVIIEAMASSLAILATDVGAVNELVDDTNGWLIRAGNIDQLAKTIQVITNVDRHTLLKKQQASRTKMESRFTWDKVMEKTIEEIKKRLS
jgi:glycosyltransferase involved in cell wall biosynthesis